MARRRSRATVVARSGTTATTMVPTARNRGTARCRNGTELPIRLPSSEHTRRGCQEPKEPSRQPERDDECAARVLRPTFLRENSRAAGSQGGSTTLRGHLRYRYLLITPVLCACRSHGLELWLFDRARRGETAKDAPGPCHQVRGRPQKVVTGGWSSASARPSPGTSSWSAPRWSDGTGRGPSRGPHSHSLEWTLTPAHPAQRKPFISPPKRGRGHRGSRRPSSKPLADDQHP